MTKNTCVCKELSIRELTIIKQGLRKYIDETTSAKELFHDEISKGLFQRQIDTARSTMDKINDCIEK